MTPLEVIQVQMVKLGESSLWRVFLRNLRVAGLAVLVLVVYIVSMLLATNVLYGLFGGWGVALGAAIALAVFLGLLLTAIEKTL